MNLRYLLLMVAVILCGACMQSMNIKNQSDKLNTELIHYGADLRWGRYNDAYGYHVKRDGTKPQVNLDRLEEFSVTSFASIHPTLNTEATEAEVPVEIKYYDEQYGTLRNLKETHKWWYDEDTKMWYNESDFPTLK